MLWNVNTLESQEQFASFGQRVAGTFVGAFGLLALALAAGRDLRRHGLHHAALIHEIGIRMTLARPRKTYCAGYSAMITGLSTGVALGLVLLFRSHAL